MHPFRHTAILPALHRLFQLCSRAGLSRSAAALAYYLTLSLFPALLLLHGLIARFRLDLSSVLIDLRPLLPAGVFTLLTDYLLQIADRVSPGLFWAGLTTLVFSASAGLRILFRTLDDLFERPHRRGAGHVLASLFLALLFLPTIHLSLFILFTGRWLFRLLDLHFPSIFPVLSTLAHLWPWLRFLLLFSALFLVVSAIYRLGIPCTAAPSHSVLAAALGACMTLVGCCIVGSAILSLSAKYKLVYGSLASLILLLVWLYLCAGVLLLGAAVLRTRSHF